MGRSEWETFRKRGRGKTGTECAKTFGTLTDGRRAESTATAETIRYNTGKGEKKNGAGQDETASWSAKRKPPWSIGWKGKKREALGKRKPKHLQYEVTTVGSMLDDQLYCTSYVLMGRRATWATCTPSLPSKMNSRWHAGRSMQRQRSIGTHPQGPCDPVKIGGVGKPVESLKTSPRCPRDQGTTPYGVLT